MIELQRCRDATSLEDVTRILDEAGIHFRIDSTAPSVDLSKIGTGNDAQMVVSVRDEDYDSARQALEADSLRFELPEDHYLLTSTDDELAEIVAVPDEWSAFDVAHARRLMKERGVTPTMVESKREVYRENLRTGKRASMYLIVGGWICCFLGGFIGLGIAWSLCHMKEKTPDGEFYTYDDWSRRVGLSMYKFGWVMMILFLLGRLQSCTR